MGCRTNETLFAIPAGPTLVTAARDDGWRVIADPGGDDVVARYLASGASVVVIEGGEAADIAPLGDAVHAASGALLAIGAADAAAICYDAGATHYLALPADGTAVATALRYASRHVRRIRGERRVLPPAWMGDRPAEALAGWIDAQGDGMTVVLVALSRLDIVNAAHGRPGGDVLIAAIAAEIAGIAERLFGGDASVARVGGAEFVMAMATDEAHAAAAIGQLGEALARPIVIDGTTAVLGSRLGVARRGAEETATALLRRAADALTLAKTSQASTIEIAAAEPTLSATTLAIDLHHAIDRGEIDVLFQPQVEIASGCVTGVEALARWEHSTLGPLGAEALFAAADRADLGVALSDHILALALARAAAWPDVLGELRLSVNVTAVDVARPGFAELLLARIDASGFPRDRLTVEITETGLMRDLDRAAALIERLRASECRVAIDDFGTGYSSLAYLKSLPLDYLKIDRALTGDIDGWARDRVIVRGVIGMARALGIATIAEGVETEAQRALLADDGCDYYQGFLLAPPVDEAGLMRLMEERRCG